MPTTKLLLIRHGETDDNHKRVFQGQGGRGMNPRGHEQAARLAARLAGGGAGGASAGPAVPLRALYCSDLERARETAAAIGRALGLDPIEDPALREVNLGAWQGLNEAEVAARFPEEWRAWKAGIDVKRGGGESYAELADRMAGAVERIVARHRGEAVAAVSHGASIRVVVARVLGIGPAKLQAFQHATNTAVNLIEFDEAGGARLVVWNDAAHLRDPLHEALCAPP